MPPEVIDSFSGEYAFLSNFAPVKVRYPDYDSPDTLEFESVEHGYQAAKTTDLTQRKWIQSAPTAGEAKRRGQRVSMRGTWNPRTRVTVMAGLLRQKFRQEPYRSQLRKTGDALLIEGVTWHDQFFGNCSCEHHRDQPGLNWLGHLLMQVRDIDLPLWDEYGY